jgi:hypothetical protein
LQEQQVGFFSVSLKKNIGVYPKAAPSHPQQATLGLQFGFSQTNSHLGLGHSGLVHCQSHLGSSQTASHSGFGAYFINKILSKLDNE